MNGVLHDAADTHLHTRIQAVGSLVGVKRRVCLSSFTTLRYPSILSSVNYITANTHSTSRRDGPDLVRLVGIYIYSALLSNSIVFEKRADLPRKRDSMSSVSSCGSRGKRAREGQRQGQRRGRGTAGLFLILVCSLLRRRASREPLSPKKVTRSLTVTHSCSKEITHMYTPPFSS
jgi:hypothetical protein